MTFYGCLDSTCSNMVPTCFTMQKTTVEAFCRRPYCKKNIYVKNKVQFSI